MSLPPSSLPDEQMQVDEHLNNERLLDQAEQHRLIEYLAAQAAADTLTQSMNLLTVDEDDDEEIDIHPCSDSECQGVHTHGDDGEYERGSPVGRTPDYDPYYTPYEGTDY